MRHASHHRHASSSVPTASALPDRFCLFSPGEKRRALWLMLSRGVFPKRPPNVSNWADHVFPFNAWDYFVIRPLDLSSPPHVCVSLSSCPFASAGQQGRGLWGGWGFSRAGCHVSDWGTFPNHTTVWKGNVILDLVVWACEPRVTGKSQVQILLNQRCGFIT